MSPSCSTRHNLQQAVQQLEPGSFAAPTCPAGAEQRNVVEYSAITCGRWSMGLIVCSTNLSCGGRAGQHDHVLCHNLQQVVHQPDHLQHKLVLRGAEQGNAIKHAGHNLGVLNWII